PIEAGAMGKPCIVTDINGANEIISNGVNGLIVPPADKESLYEAMSKIASDKALCSRLAASARQMAADRYARSIVWDSLKDFYKETLQER
ncbi:MAG: glycosyltransferase, partial [Bacteroidales bacterium]|nr:glycosyltransferase [Bacteroidales bacterium]